MLTKEQILSSEDLTKEIVDVPEWGGEVYVRAMTGTERDAFEASIVKDGGTNLANIRAKLCALCMVDEDGNRLFIDGDVLALGKKSALALDRVFNAAQKLNGIAKDDVKDMVKNSEEGQSEDSISD